ncbi:hypothetical protein ARMSODRAFT_1027215 [Armillaria solidipes]|uniref:Uncharacterized protein n=1 Tax=Armillaria solidipes TaxID=1076256 RepID=A0A2H3ALA9_9AGAR|nr:hypothetical protein ARMSODRAFT_1027215 [Armillaria solidipes]
MSAQPLEAIPLIETTFGACYVGTIIAAILFGISNLQVVIYYKRYPNDWWVYRYSVALLWVLDTLHVGLSTHALYFYLITMSGDLIGGLENGLWSMKLQLSLNISLVIYVQWLYVIRLWRLGRFFHKILPSFVFLAVTTSLGTTICKYYFIHWFLI